MNSKLWIMKMCRFNFARPKGSTKHFRVFQWIVLLLLPKTITFWFTLSIHINLISSHSRQLFKNKLTLCYLPSTKWQTNLATSWRTYWSISQQVFPQRREVDTKSEKDSEYWTYIHPVDRNITPNECNVIICNFNIHLPYIPSPPVKTIHKHSSKLVANNTWQNKMC